MFYHFQPTQILTIDNLTRISWGQTWTKKKKKEIVKSPPSPRVKNKHNQRMGETENFHYGVIILIPIIFSSIHCKLGWISLSPFVGSFYCWLLCVHITPWNIVYIKLYIFLWFHVAVFCCCMKPRVLRLPLGLKGAKPMSLEHEKKVRTTSIKLLKRYYERHYESSKMSARLITNSRHFSLRMELISWVHLFFHLSSWSLSHLRAQWSNTVTWTLLLWRQWHLIPTKDHDFQPVRSSWVHKSRPRPQENLHPADLDDGIACCSYKITFPGHTKSGLKVHNGVFSSDICA